MSEFSIKKEKLIDRISSRLAEKDSLVLSRIGKSIQRDRDFPTHYLLKKGFKFFKNLLQSRFFLRKCTVVGKSPRVDNKPYLVNNGKMIIGDFVNICSRSVCCDLVSYPGGELIIGNNVFINFGTTINAKKKVRIGNNVKIGPYCMIHDTDFHIQGKDFVNPEGVPISIEEDAWLGSRVIVLKGSKIGKGAIIAAGSVVSGIIPPNAIAAGMPAKIIRFRRSEEDIDIKKPCESLSDLTSEEIKKINSLVCNVLEIDENYLLEMRDAAYIDAWTSEKHLKIIKHIEREFDLIIQENIVVKLSNIDKIYKHVAEINSKHDKS